MEDPNLPPPPGSSEEQAVLSQEALGFLMKAARWGKFLAIIGFIMLAFLLLAGISMGLIFSIMEDKMSSLMGGTATMIPPKWLSVAYVILSVITFIPVFFLNSFSNNVSKAVRNNDSRSLTASMRSLKNLFVFIGVYTILLIAVYIIAIIIVASAAALAM